MISSSQASIILLPPLETPHLLSHLCTVAALRRPLRAGTQVFNFMGLGGPAFDNRKVVTPWQRQRSCRLQDADSLDRVCTDFTGC